MTNSPYRCADDRFPWMKVDYLGDTPMFFMMCGPRSESWYSCGIAGLKDYLDLIQPGDTVIDCGANEGFIAVAAALKAGPLGKVYALEAARHNIDPLKINTKLNQLDGRLHTHHCAVGDTVGFTTVNGEIMGPGEMVVLRTIDSFDWTPHLIKIDVEGYELKVLRGARETLLKHRPTLFLEAHLSGASGVDMSRFGDSPGAVLDFLKEVKYHATLMDGTPVTEASQMPNGVVLCEPE